MSLRRQLVPQAVLRLNQGVPELLRSFPRLSDSLPRSQWGPFNRESTVQQSTPSDVRLTYFLSANYLILNATVAEVDYYTNDWDTVVNP